MGEKTKSAEIISSALKTINIINNKPHNSYDKLLVNITLSRVLTIIAINHFESDQIVTAEG